MAIYTKDGLYINTTICLVVSKWLAAPLTSLNGEPDPTKRLVIRSSSTEAGYASEALLIAALEANGWSLYSAPTIPDAPTVDSTTVVVGSPITVTIADDGDIKVYKDGAIFATLTDQDAGDVIFPTTTTGNYYFILSVDGVDSNQSEVVAVLTEVETIVPDVVFPYEWSGVHKAKGYDLMNIQQSGTYGNVITDLAWSSFESYGNFLGDNAPAKWCINRGPWKTGAISNYTITGLNGELVEIRKGIGFRDKGGVQVPSKTVSAFIRIGS